MRVLTILFLFFFGLSSGKVLALTQECESALQSLFSEKVSKEQAGEFLKLQGDITLHRLAWAYLKKQKEDQDDKIQSVERAIIELLNDKYTNANPDFVKAREAYEAQPLSRTALADIAPYLKEALAGSYEEKDKIFKLNASDLKLLAAIARQERATAVGGKFDHRMLDSNSPQGMLNFVKLINSSYKVSSSQTEQDLQIEMKLSGLERVMASMQDRLSRFLDSVDVPSACKNQVDCNPDTTMGEFFKQNEDLQEIFWESLADKLVSDDVLLEKLSYGDLWLKVKASPSAATVKDTTPASKASISSFSTNVPKSNPALKPIHPVEAQNAGLIVEDPVGVIVKDRPGRSRQSFESFGKDFQKAMADAILADEKVFSLNGKLYDRKTGKQLVPEFALSFLSPAQQLLARDALAASDPKLKVPQAQAWVNGDQVFIANDTLYDLNGKPLNPSLVISEVMSNKIGVDVDPARYKGTDSAHLIARANALKNNRPYYIAGGKTLDSFTGRDISSPFREVATVDAKIDKARRRMFENLSDAELIINYHRERPNPDCGYYGIVDKKNAVFKVYANDGKEVYASEVLVGAEVSDQRTRWTEYTETQRTPSGTTGAGIFTIRPQDLNDTFNQQHFNNNLFSLKDEKNKDTVFAIHQVPIGLESRNTRFGTKNPNDRRVSGGCANLKLSDFKAMKKWLGPACKVYVLPEEEGNKFVMDDNKLRLVSSKPVEAKRSNFYNYSSLDTKPAPIDIKIVNNAGNTQQAREFIKALEDEKATLMKLYRLSNDEYNDLAMLAYGILGNESKFGTSTKLKAKEFSFMGMVFGQAGVIGLRAVAGRDDILNTSRGLTQIKFLPEGDFTKQYPEIKKSNLINPRNSAIATIGYLAEAAKTMREIAIENNDDTGKLRITRENMMDYMGYLYQGGSSKLKADDPIKQATPEYNTYFQGLQRNMSYIEVTQRIE